MNSREILSNHPKIAEKIKEWWIEKMIKAMSQHTNEGNVREHLKQDLLISGLIERAMDANPHTFFEMFDNIGVYIMIAPFGDESAIMFTHSFSTKELRSTFIGLVEGTIFYSTRKEAEEAALLDVIKYVENNFEKIYGKEGQDSGASGGETTEQKSEGNTEV